MFSIPKTYSKISESGLGGMSKICELPALIIAWRLVAVVTFVMMGVQWSWVQREEVGHWLALVQRPSHQPHSVTRDDIKQDVQLVS